MRNLASELFAYEAGELSTAEELELFSALIQSGWVYELQVHYRRVAHDYVLAGLLSRNGDILAEPDEMEAW